MHPGPGRVRRPVPDRVARRECRRPDLPLRLPAEQGRPREDATALRDIDCRGALVIESFTNRVKSIARAAATWRPLATSQDALAQEGVARHAPGVDHTLWGFATPNVNRYLRVKSPSTVSLPVDFQPGACMVTSHVPGVNPGKVVVLR